MTGATNVSLMGAGFVAMPDNVAVLWDLDFDTILDYLAEELEDRAIKKNSG